MKIYELKTKKKVLYIILIKFLELQNENLSKDNFKLNLKNTILFNDINSISNTIKKDTINITSQSHNQAQSDKNKVFSQLINQMRRATKIISILDKNFKSFSENI